MLDMCKFSIIIPCFNNGKKIDELFEMLYTNSFEDYEVIFVDDCSEDNTYDLMCLKKSTYRNYYVYKMDTNSGPGPTRNYGLKFARGEYIIFCDSDDEFDIECLVYIDKFLKEHTDADLLVFPHEIVRGNRHIKNDTYAQYENFASIAPRDIANGCAGPVAKVFKNSIIKDKNVEFPERITGEDACFIVNYSVFVKKAYKLENVFYKYIMNKQSITHKKNNDLELETTFEVLQPIFHKFFPEIEIAQFVNGHLLTRAKQMCSNNFSLAEIKKWFEKENKRYPDWIKHISYSEQSVYRKLIYSAMYKNRPLMIKLIMMIRRVIY